MCGFSPLPFACQVHVQLVGHKSLECGGEVAGNDLIVVNVEVLEHRLVKFTAGNVVGLLVLRVCRAEQCEAVIQVSGDVVLVQLVGVQRCLGFRSGCSDSRLFATQLRRVDGVGIERVENLLAVAVELRKSVGSFLPCGRRIGKDGAHVFEDEGADLVDMMRAQCHRLPVCGDCIFELVHLDGAEGATVLEAVSTEAVEVVVEGADTIA